MIIASVLKTSAEYLPKHAQWLHKQLIGYDSVCLSDVQIPGVKSYYLRHNWPGWWSKMELFDPTGPLGKEDILYLDIDTVVLGDLTPFLERGEFTMLTDFYRENVFQPPPASGVMFIPAGIKELVWNAWMVSPDKNMAANRTPKYHGDQGFLLRQNIPAARWQNVLPGKVCSYKKDIACRGMVGYNENRSEGNGTVPSSVSIVCFHGKPRPWDVSFSWVPPFK